ncbi:MAG: tRNA dihydrouridine synthase DusB [Candidatus Omnitrophica bacterium]|nr:tRNA dihydrouridine synthase DusB [Candidatus Omnitrophota bacterium]MDD5236777.1 tRNA dihydrouridine synthase DusB [Candidatus Omnitrophota bacterium]MDD5611312.1 tRNA dihydrouridine synthase DusB [Candidatus Omnitrophota bacterium]
MLKIGDLKLNYPFIIAPMAGITDLSFRLLNHEFGCELAFTEMINVRSLGYNSKKTFAMLSTHTLDKPLGVQILGCEPKFILRAMDILKKFKFDILDFNAACPQKKVVRRGEGASLLKEPKKLNKLLKLVVQNSNCPVTVKVRTGWNSTANVKDIALWAEDAGINALFIHGRTQAQGYSGKADYQAIKIAKESLGIPVIASGDIFSASLAKKMFDETGCDGITLARGALGNPWLFREIAEFILNKKVIPRPCAEEISKIMLRHLDLLIDFHSEKVGVILFRKFFSWYTKGFKGVKPLRQESCLAKKKQEMVAIIQKFLALQEEAALIY